MKHWQFMDFLLNANRNAIKDWYDGLSVQARADFDTLISQLETQRLWQMPDYRVLTGNKKLKGLGEIRFTTENTQHRVIGYFGPEAAQFSLLLGCTHKQRVYSPASALDTAAKRKRLIESGKGNISKHEI